MVDDLLGKTIGFIICEFKLFECIKLQEIYKDLQREDSNFIAIWIPALWPEDCGHATYTRLIECMPWATFAHPELVNYVKRRDPRFVVLDKEGQIAHQDAWGLLLASGLKAYPFTQDTVPQSIFSMESESYLEILLHGMYIVGRKLMKRKMIFLYAGHPGEYRKMNSKLEVLTQFHGNSEVLYVGRFYKMDIPDIENCKQVYEDAVEDMPWPSLSFSDMITFWYRCCELNKEPNIRMLHGLVEQLFFGERTTLVLVDNNGPVTCRGYDVLQMICESSQEMRMVKNESMRGAV